MSVRTDPHGHVIPPGVPSDWHSDGFGNWAPPHEEWVRPGKTQPREKENGMEFTPYHMTLEKREPEEERDFDDVLGEAFAGSAPQSESIGTLYADDHPIHTALEENEELKHEVEEANAIIELRDAKIADLEATVEHFEIAFQEVHESRATLAEENKKIFDRAQELKVELDDLKRDVQGYLRINESQR